MCVCGHERDYRIGHMYCVWCVSVCVCVCVCGHERDYRIGHMYCVCCVYVCLCVCVGEHEWDCRFDFVPFLLLFFSIFPPFITLVWLYIQILYCLTYLCFRIYEYTIAPSDQVSVSIHK